MSGLSDALLQARGIDTAQGGLQLGWIDSLQGWDLLEPHWQAVHERTPGASVFQTYPYLRTWWDCLGSNGKLLIIVVLQNELPVCIAPLQITLLKRLGAPVRTISFIGQPSESDRPTILGNSDPDIARAIADYLFELKPLWDSVVLFEQPQDSEIVQALRERLRKERYLQAQVDGNECPYINVSGTWSSYLGTRTKAFRKSLKRRRAQLEALGTLQCETVDAGDNDNALERYRAVEERSWKRAQNLGVARSPRHWHFHRELVRHPECEGWLRFTFLKLDGVDIAATFGLLWRRRFYSLHVAHDAAQVDTSPGVVLTAMELETIFAQGVCDHYDFLGGFLSNKRGWASASQHTTALFGDRPGPRSLAFHWVYFRIKPVMRRVLTRAGAMQQVSRALQKFRRSRTPPPVDN